MARETSTGGRIATTGVIPGAYALSVGNPNTPLPDGWEWTRLTDVARLESGHTPSRRHPEYWGGTVPWIGIRDATGNHGQTIYDTEQKTNDLGIANSSARILPVDTVCLSRTASVGYVVMMGVPMATSQDFVNWVCGERLNPHFLKYLLLLENSSFKMFSMGTTHQTIYFPEVKAFHIAMPSRHVQDQIVEILGALDEKIDLNRRMNNVLEETAQATFKDWFVEFGPTRAKANGLVPYLAADIWAMFPDCLDDFEKPLGWNLGRLDDILVLQRGFDLPSTQRTAGEYPVIAASGWNGTHAHYMASAPGVTTGRSGVLGKVFFIQENFWPLNTSLWVKEFKLSSPLFAYFLLQGLDLEIFNAGSAVPTLNRNHIHSLSTVVPPAPLLEMFEDFGRPLMARLKDNESEIQTLMGARNLLLTRLISGETRVKDDGHVLDHVA